MDMKIIDWELALKVAGNNRELANDLLALLIKNLPTDILAIQQAHADDKQSDLLQRVHKLHGGVSYCGLPRLKKLLANLEADLKKQRIDDVALLLNQLSSESSLLLKVFQTNSEL